MTTRTTSASSACWKTSQPTSRSGERSDGPSAGGELARRLAVAAAAAFAIAAHTAIVHGPPRRAGGRAAGPRASRDPPSSRSRAVPRAPLDGSRGSSRHRSGRRMARLPGAEAQFLQPFLRRARRRPAAARGASSGARSRRRTRAARARSSRDHLHGASSPPLKRGATRAESPSHGRSSSPRSSRCRARSTSTGMLEAWSFLVNIVGPLLVW